MFITALSYVAATLFVALPIIALVVACIGLVYLAKQGVSCVGDYLSAQRRAELECVALDDAEYLSAAPLTMGPQYESLSVVGQIAALIAMRAEACGDNDEAEAHFAACLLGFASWGRLRAEVSHVGAETATRAAEVATRLADTKPQQAAPAPTTTQAAPATPPPIPQRATTPQQAAPAPARVDEAALAEALAEALISGDKAGAASLAAQVAELAHLCSDELVAIASGVGKRGFQRKRQAKALRALASK